MRLILGRTALVVASLGLPAAVLAQETPTPAPCGPWQMMHGWGMDWGWGGMFLGPLFMIAWLALLVAVIVLVIRWLGGGSFGVGSPPRTPREILDERFAKGEIDREEFENRRKALGS